MTSILQRAIASGAVSSSKMALDVVPESGPELYSYHWISTDYTWHHLIMYSELDQNLVQGQ
ncbi:MAG: hypothetical protein ACE14P_09260 [Methanotrichaceae archaeon]